MLCVVTSSLPPANELTDNRLSYLLFFNYKKNAAVEKRTPLTMNSVVFVSFSIQISNFLFYIEYCNKNTNSFSCHMTLFYTLWSRTNILGKSLLSYQSITFGSCIRSTSCCSQLSCFLELKPIIDCAIPGKLSNNNLPGAYWMIIYLLFFWL